MFRVWGFKETLHVPLSGWAAALSSGQQPIHFSGQNFPKKKLPESEADTLDLKS
jgi:hypothetical protein